MTQPLNERETMKRRAELTTKHRDAMIEAHGHSDYTDGLTRTIQQTEDGLVKQLN